MTFEPRVEYGASDLPAGSCEIAATTNASLPAWVPGDCFMTISVWKNRYKPWVRQLVGPYVCTFSIACIVSAGTIAQKLKLVRERHQSRNAALRNGPLVLGGVAVPIELAQNEALKTLKEKFDQNQLATKKMYCSILLGLVEGAQRTSEHLHSHDGTYFQRARIVQMRPCRRFPSTI